MSDLKSQLIKLGSTNPELRPHIRAVLASLPPEREIRNHPSLRSVGDVTGKHLQDIRTKIDRAGVKVPTPSLEEEITLNLEIDRRLSNVLLALDGRDIKRR